MPLSLASKPRPSEQKAAGWYAVQIPQLLVLFIQLSIIQPLKTMQFPDGPPDSAEAGLKHLIIAIPSLKSKQVFPFQMAYVLESFMTFYFSF